MEVTRHNFEEVLPAVKSALEGCHYFSFDLEMTGLHVKESRSSFFEDIHDRYAQMVESAQAFQITQFGLSAFKWEGSRYVARTFNFYVFPRPTEGFDRRFLSQVHDGVRYLPAATRDAKLAALQQERGGADAGFNRGRRDIPLTKPDDRAFTEKLAASVDAWLQGAESTLLLPEVNGYLRRLQYQHIHGRGSSAASGFVIERVTGANSQAALRLTRASPEEARAWEASQAAAGEDAVHQAAGFTAVFEAMRACGAPAVGHNLAWDLAYTLEAFVGPLPPSWAEYKALAAAWFPGGVYDTKRLSTELPEGQTSLGEVYDVCSGVTVAARMTPGQPAPSVAAAGVPLDALPPIEHAPGFVRYEGNTAGSFAHEAGYDAYMTAASFATLLRLLELRRGDGAGFDVLGADCVAEPPSLDAAAEFLGQLNLVRTDIPYAALVGDDPVLDRRHVFHVSQMAPGTRHPDIAMAFASAGLGRIHSQVLDAAGTSAAVAVLDVEASSRVVPSLATWGPQIVLFEDWPKQQRSAAAKPEAASAIPAAVGDGHSRIKRRRVDAAAAQSASAAVEAPLQRNCAIQ